jgi:dCTP deaminase
MILSDRDIRVALDFKEIEISPMPSDDAFQPSSIDLRLGEGFISIDGTKLADKQITVQPNDFLLASTLESVQLPSGIVAKLEGKSSIGRKGIFVHVTAGYVDPGWKGRLTLEIYNASSEPYVLKSGDKICQIRFMRLSSPVERMYGDSELGSHYQNSGGTRASYDKGSTKKQD